MMMNASAVTPSNRPCAPRQPTVAVLGATGLMGRHIARGLELQFPEAHVLHAARRERNCAPDCPYVYGVNLHNPGTLVQLLARADVVINAVGPYTYNGRHIPAIVRLWELDLIQAEWRGGGGAGYGPYLITVTATRKGRRFLRDYQQPAIRR